MSAQVAVLTQGTRTGDPPIPLKFTNTCHHESESLSELDELIKNPSCFQIRPALHNQEDSSQFSPEERVEDQDGFLQRVSCVKCTSCDKSIALLYNGKYSGLNGLLTNHSKIDGWATVSSEPDQLALFILNQIIYREYEKPDENLLQTDYSFPPSSDLRRLLWENGKAIGFYSAKPKGSLDLETLDWYRMPVLDTLFVRKSARRKGYASSCLNDIMQEFPSQNIGVSCPISLPMIQVFKKHLLVNHQDRMRFWEVEGCGGEGCCQILWFSLNRR